MRPTAIGEAARLGISDFKPDDLITNPKLAIKFGADCFQATLGDLGHYF